MSMDIMSKTVQEMMTNAIVKDVFLAVAQEKILPHMGLLERLGIQGKRGKRLNEAEVRKAIQHLVRNSLLAVERGPTQSWNQYYLTPDGFEAERKLKNLAKQSVA